MEGVYHIDVVEIGSGRLVSQIDGVFERNVPDGERLEFSVSRLDSAKIFVIELRETGGEFPASGTGGCDDNELSLRFDIFVSSVAALADYSLYVLGVAGDRIVAVYLHAEIVKLLGELLCGGL